MVDASTMTMLIQPSKPTNSQKKRWQYETQNVVYSNCSIRGLPHRAVLAGTAGWYTSSAQSKRPKQQWLCHQTLAPAVWERPSIWLVGAWWRWSNCWCNCIRKSHQRSDAPISWRVYPRPIRWVSCSELAMNSKRRMRTRLWFKNLPDRIVRLMLSKW